MARLFKFLTITSFVWILRYYTPPPIWCGEEIPRSEVSNPNDLAKLAVIAMVFSVVEEEHGHLEEAAEHRNAARRFVAQLKSHLISNEGIKE